MMLRTKRRHALILYQHRRSAPFEKVYSGISGELISNLARQATQFDLSNCHYENTPIQIY